MKYLRKTMRRTVAVLLAAAIVIGFVPITELAYGDGVHAATAKEIVDDALSWAVTLNEYGKPTSTPIVNYVYGGLDLNVGVDCSGFVCAIFNRHGIDLVSMGVRSSYDMQTNYAKFGTKLDTTDFSAIKSGDILITNNGGHAGIAWVNGSTPMIIHSMNYECGVVVETLEMYTRSSNLVCIIRPYGVNGIEVNPIKGPGPLTTSNYGDTSVSRQDDPDAFDIDNPGAPFTLPKVTIESTNADNVKWLEKAFNTVEGLKLPIDGVMGEGVLQTIKDFQVLYGLPQTGVADKTTIDKLVERHKNNHTVTAVKIYAAKSDAEKYAKEADSTLDTTDSKKDADTSSSTDASKAGSSSGSSESGSSGSSGDNTKSGGSSGSGSSGSSSDSSKNSGAKSSSDSSESGKEDEELVEVNELKLDEEGSVKLIAKYVPETAKNVTITWESTDKEVVKVSEKGEVTAVDGGEAEIIAKASEKVFAKVKIKVISSTHMQEWRNGKWYNASGVQDYAPRGEWKSNSYGIWYQDTSGWYPKSEWVKIDDRWYYFNSNGYAYKNGWSKIDDVWYYFRSTGNMAENEWLNGYWLDKGGAWTYEYKGEWKQDSKGWWFEDTAGWYPKSQVVKIDGKEYKFGADGYWISE